jgi:hypothetical protein
MPHSSELNDLPETPDNGSVEDKRRKRRFRLHRLILVILIATLFIAGGLFFVYRYAISQAKSRVVEKLAAVNNGPVEIERVSLGWDGIRAENVRLSQEGDAEAWIAIGQLFVQSPLSKLISDAPVIDRIEIKDTTINLKLDEQGALLHNFNTGGTSTLPSKIVDISNAKLIITQPDRNDFVVDGVNLQLNEKNGVIEFSGLAADLVESSWKFDGTYASDTKAINLDANTESLQIDSAKIARWPLIPQHALDALLVQGNATASLNLKTDAQGKLDYRFQLTPQSIDFRVPRYDLRFNIVDGRVEIVNGKLLVADALAEFGGGTYVASGVTDFTQTPIVGDFNAVLTGVAVESISKLARIPPQVRGKMTGTGIGNYSIGGDNSFTLSLKASGTSSDASYDEIPLESTSVEVAIDALKLRKDFSLRELSGNVIVKANADEVAITKFEETFGLAGPLRRVNVQGTANADVNLNIPLATANQVSTWDLQVVGDARQLKLANEIFQNIAADVNIVDGALSFQKLTGRAITEKSGRHAGLISAVGKWPLVQNQNAQFEVETTDLSVEWLVGIAKEYSPDVDRLLQMIDRQYDGENSSVDGKLTVKATIEVPADAADDISKWNVSGTIQSGEVSVDGRSIQSIQSTFELKNSVFTLKEFTGQVDGGGSISVKGTIPIDPKAAATVDVSASEFPLNWLLTLGSEFSEEFRQRVKQLQLDSGDAAKPTSGLLTFDFHLDRLAAQDDVVSPWLLDTTVHSDQLVLRGTEFNQFKANVKLTKTEVQVKQLEAALKARGTIKASGVWPLDREGAGNIELSWARLPLELLAELAGLTGLPLQGTTSGNLQLNRAPDDDSLQVQGLVSADDLQIGEILLQRIQFNLTTKDELITLSQIQYGESDLDLNLHAQIANKAPYQFQLKADIQELELAQLARIDLIEQAIGDQLPQLSGIAFLRADFSGTLEPLDYQSSGDVSIKNLQVAQRDLRDVEINWRNIGADLTKAQAEINVLGGSLVLTEVGTKPERIAVRIDKFDAELVSTLLQSPVKFTGLLSGQASLDSWSDPEIIGADLQLSGASTIVGQVELGALDGHLTLRRDLLNYEIHGTLLDGSVIAQGETNLPADYWVQISLPVSIELVEANLNRLSRESRTFESLRELTGKLSAKLALNIDGPEFLPKGSGNIDLSEITYKSVDLLSRSTTNVTFDHETLGIPEFRAEAAGGQVRGQAQLRLSDRISGSYSLELSHLDLAKLAIFMPGTRYVHGFLNARTSGSIGRYISGTGQIALENASLYAIDGETVRLPVLYQINTQDFSGRFEVRESRFSIFDGNVIAMAAVEFGNRFNIEFSAQAANIDTGKMIAAATGSDKYRQGTLSGTLRLSGRSIRSVDDLQGTFVGSVDRAQALQLPVLQQMAVFLNTGRLTQESFDSDEIRMRLSNGRIEVSQLALSSQYGQFLITGAVTTDQRLDLQVIGRTGNLDFKPLLLSQFNSPLLKFQTPTLALLSKVTEYLSNRLIYVHIGGTVRSPSFELQTNLLLRDEVIRFFLRGTEVQNLLNNRQIR